MYVVQQVPGGKDVPLSHMHLPLAPLAFLQQRALEMYEGGDDADGDAADKGSASTRKMTVTAVKKSGHSFHKIKETLKRSFGLTPSSASHKCVRV